MEQQPDGGLTVALVLLLGPVEDALTTRRRPE